MKKNIFFLIGGLIFGSFLAIILITTNQSKSIVEKARAQQVARGSVLSNITFTNLNGDSISIEEYKGHPLLINFWATWCPPCQAEMPLLEKTFETYSPDLIVIGISVDDTISGIPQFISDNSITFPIFHDSKKREMQIIFNVNGFPTSYFVDAEGVLQAMHIGMLNETQLNGYLETIGVGK